MSTQATQSPARPYHHGDLRAAILERAAEIIGEEGIEALSLRGIARDLGVSHGAPNRHFPTRADLLATLAAEGWQQIRAATLGAAEACGTDNPNIRLNAMGRGFLRWAMEHPALFRAIYHPDVARFADDTLRAAVETFKASVREEVARTQATGRYPEVPLTTLTLFTNSVPFGVATMMLDPILGTDIGEKEREAFIEQVINLVVPIDGQV